MIEQAGSAEENSMTKAEARIQRVQRMERALDEILAAEQALNAALDQFEKLPAQVKKLDAYYAGHWMEDYEADEAGLLPPDLKRGVLSQDAVWDALGDYRRLVLRMLDAVKNSYTKGPF